MNKREHYAMVLQSIFEDLASIEHQRWAHWQKYLHEKATKQSDGSLLLPRELVQHWEKQIDTAYSNLSEEEKESDREQVKKYLPLILDALSKRTQ